MIKSKSIRYSFAFLAFSAFIGSSFASENQPSASEKQCPSIDDVIEAIDATPMFKRSDHSLEVTEISDYIHKKTNKPFWTAQLFAPDINRVVKGKNGECIYKYNDHRVLILHTQDTAKAANLK